MNLIIRQPTEREVGWIRQQWTSDLTLVKKTSGRVVIPTYTTSRTRGQWDEKRPQEEGPGYFKTANPRALTSSFVYRQAMQLIVPALMQDAELRVGALSTVPGEPLGWIAWRSDTLLYARVLGDFRRRGIGTALFETTGLEPGCVCAFLNVDAAKWLASMHPAQAVETEAVAHV